MGLTENGKILSFQGPARCGAVKVWEIPLLDPIRNMTEEQAAGIIELLDKSRGLLLIPFLWGLIRLSVGS